MYTLEELLGILSICLFPHMYLQIFGQPDKRVHINIVVDTKALARIRRRKQNNLYDKMNIMMMLEMDVKSEIRRVQTLVSKDVNVTLIWTKGHDSIGNLAQPVHILLNGIVTRLATKPRNRGKE